MNSSNYSNVLNDIDNIDIPENMTTDISAGINKAKDVLSTFTNTENDDVVIFLGDGEPDEDNTNDNPTRANNAATTLKGSATLYTIGFGIEGNTKAQNLLKNMASTDEETKQKLYYTASNKQDLINSFDTISSEAGRVPTTGEKTSEEGIVTINLTKTLADDQKITITVDGTPTEYDYNSLPSELTYDSANRTITWDIRGYDADAELTISYVLSK